MPETDRPEIFGELQANTGWGKTLADFAVWTLAAAPPAPGAWALDVGCGPGLLPALLARAGYRAVGLDLDFAMLPAAKPAFSPVQGDGAASPFAAGAFHLVTAVNVLFFQPDPLTLLAEMVRILAPGGTIALLNPSEYMSVAAAAALAEARGLDAFSRQTLLDWAARAERHHRWSAAGLTALFEQVGLQWIGTDTRIGRPGLARLVVGRNPPKKL